MPNRLARVAAAGAEAVDITALGDASLADGVRDRTDGRCPDAATEAVGMEAQRSGGIEVVQKLLGARWRTPVKMRSAT